MGYKMEVGISNKHIHLSQEHLEILFGKGHELTKKKDIVQPGQFAAEEKVDIVGPKCTYSVRVLGPTRPETQVEISLTDARQMGIKAPIKLSGDLDGTPGCKLVGPCGEIELEKGVIVAKRHAHFTDAQAAEAGVVDGQVIKLKMESPERTTVFDDVICRVGSKHFREVHVDTDEGNAAGIGPDAMCEIVE